MAEAITATESLEPPPAEPTVADERLARQSVWKRLLIRPEFGALAGALVVWLLFAWQAKDTWLTWGGTATYLDTAALYGLSAVAIALLMIGGEFDLSSGVMVGTAGMFTGLFAVHSGFNFWLAMALSLVICLAIGFLNGYMVIKSGLPSFIVTLGTFFILRGFNLWLTQKITSQTNVTGVDRTGGFSSADKLFASAPIKIGGVEFKADILWFIGITAVAAWVLLRTKIGNWIFAVGGNKEAARRVGVPANATKVGLFMVVAACGWLHGMVVLTQTGRSNVIEGVGQEFYFIIAAVLGGCLLTGGFGRRRGLRVPHPRHDAAGHRARRVGQQPLLLVPRCDPARGRIRQRVDPQLGAASGPTVQTARCRGSRRWVSEHRSEKGRTWLTSSSSTTSRSTSAM
jgi:simple sugar transport system permease protein